MHFDIEATSERDPTVFSLISWLCFLRSYQPYQINTLFRYIPCTKQRASGNSCQPQTGTQASKKAGLIISSSWCFHFYISFENLVTFTRCTGNVILASRIFSRLWASVSSEDHQYARVLDFLRSHNTAISCAFKITLKRKDVFHIQ